MSSWSTNVSSEEGPEPAPSAPSHPTAVRERKRRRRRSGGSFGPRASAVLEWAGVGCAVGVIGLAPLMAGTVHRPTMLLAFVAVAVALAASMASVALRGKSFRFGAVVLIPLAFLLVPIVQSIPLPMGLRSVLDPNGSALLADNALQPIAAWPLSLDPANTRVYVGRAAAALALFLVVYH